VHLRLRFSAPVTQPISLASCSSLNQHSLARSLTVPPSDTGCNSLRSCLGCGCQLRPPQSLFRLRIGRSSFISAYVHSFSIPILIPIDKRHVVILEMASSGLGSVSNSASSQGGGTLRQEASALARQVNRLLNRQLSSVCQVNGVKSTGIKADLQGRIHNRKLRSIHTQFRSP
jgi:hypothetical protein